MYYSKILYTKVYLLSKECEDHYFGRNCQENCNVTCQSCNKTTGVCDSGCYPGWRGLYCQDSNTLFFPLQTKEQKMWNVANCN